MSPGPAVSPGRAELVLRYAYALATDEMHTRSRWGEWDACRAAHLDGQHKDHR